MSTDERIEALRKEITEAFAQNVIGRDSPGVVLDALNERAPEMLARFNRMGEGDRIRFYATLVDMDPEEAIRTVSSVQIVRLSFSQAQSDPTKVDMNIGLTVLLRRKAENVGITFRIDGDE